MCITQCGLVVQLRVSVSSHAHVLMCVCVRRCSSPSLPRGGSRACCSSSRPEDGASEPPPSAGLDCRHVSPPHAHTQVTHLYSHTGATHTRQRNNNNDKKLRTSRTLSARTFSHLQLFSVLRASHCRRGNGGLCGYEELVRCCRRCC